MSAGRPRLMVVTTVPVTAWALMRGKLRFLNENGFDVVLVSSPGAELDRTAEREGVRAIAVPMARPVRPPADLLSLARLVRLIRAERPHVVLAGTPKAGLVACVALYGLAVLWSRQQGTLGETLLRIRREMIDGR